MPHYRAEILTLFGSYLGRNDGFINSFWNLLTFIVDFYCSRAFMAFDPEELKAVKKREKQIDNDLLGS